ncbi:MAG: TIGR03087 family PEP-CTERM/XrtA system glycosyltransferase [Sphingomonas sp.]
MGDILFLAHRVPYPPDRGDKIRGFHLLQHLSAKARVHLLAFADVEGDLAHDEALSHHSASRTVLWRSGSQARAAARALLARRPVSLAAFDDRRMHDAVSAALSRNPIDTIYVFSSQMAQYLPADTRAKLVMDFVDMDSAKFAAYADAARGPMRWMLRREARLLQRFEGAVARRADASLFVSRDEAALFRTRTGADRVCVIENGIDTDHYDPAARFAPVDRDGPLIVFTGQMDYRPNAEGVAWFAEAILPCIRHAHPGARFAIVGRNPGDAVRALAKRPGVLVTGEVPDVRGWLAAASVVVAPLRLARGIQNKVLEGMAMARPVVASVAAARGIDHGSTIAVGESGAALAEAVASLLADPARAAELGAAARRQVQARYAWPARLADLDAILGIAPNAARAAA